MKSEQPAPRDMSRDECLQMLSATNVGRVALSEHALPTIVPVVYAVTTDSIIFRAGDGLLSTAARQRHVVCFETDLLDPASDTLSSVTIVGQLAPLDAGRTQHLVPNNFEPSVGDEIAMSTSVVRGHQQSLASGDHRERSPF